MPESNDPSITFSVITATYNADAVLPQLIDSLKAQTDQEFEWIVADGESSDNTLALLEDAKQSLNLTVDSRPDFGIYDALNRAIKLAKGEYYLVMGADDVLFPDAVAAYKTACMTSKKPLVTAKVEINGICHGKRASRKEWICGQNHHISNHSVGVAIKRSLHETFGFYSSRFPITADQLFIMTSTHNGTEVHEADFIAGQYSADGTSGKEALATAAELFLVNIKIGHSKIVQMLLLNYRFVKIMLRSALKHITQKS